MRRQIITGLSGTMGVVALAEIVLAVRRHDGAAALAWLLAGTAWVVLGLREAQR